MADRRTAQDVARRRAVLVAATGLTCAAVPLIGFAALADRLPARAVTIGATAHWELVFGPITLVVLVWGAGAAAYLLRSPRAALRWAVGAVCGAMVLLSGQLVAIVVSNLVPASPSWWAHPAVLAAGLAVGLLGWWAAGPGPELPPVTAGPGPSAPRMPMRSAERAVWIRSVLCARRLWQAAGWVVFAALTGLINGHLPAVHLIPQVVVAVTVVVLAVQAWARVRVDGRGVWVEQPLLRRRLVGVDLAHVREATAEVVGARPLPGGFGVLNTERLWGYRATKGGELLRLATSDGRDFVVTVPDAATAAALVNTELDRRGVPAC